MDLEMALFIANWKSKTRNNIVMHQSFVNTGPSSQGIGGILTFLFAKPGYTPSTVGTFL